MDGYRYNILYGVDFYILKREIIVKRVSVNGLIRMHMCMRSV